jgi:hypothetical protein
MAGVPELFSLSACKPRCGQEVTAGKEPVDNTDAQVALLTSEMSALKDEVISLRKSVRRRRGGWLHAALAGIVAAALLGGTAFAGAATVHLAGITWQGQWATAASYQVNDVVYNGGAEWIAVKANAAAAPSNLNQDWATFLPQGATGVAGPQGVQGIPGPMGLTWQDQWSSGATYKVNDVVLYNGSEWIATAAITGTVPGTTGAAWSVFVPQGAQGPMGPQGQPGANGSQGAAGPQGLPGLGGCSPPFIPPFCI